MPRVRLTQNTYHVDPAGSQGHPRRLSAGLAVDVDKDTADRWVRNGIAEQWSGPTGQMSDADAGGSVEDIDRKIAQLEELRARRLEQGPSAQQSGGLPEDDERDLSSFYPDGLAEFDFLKVEQKTALKAAGFTNADRIAAASDEELEEVEGIGPGTIKKLRAPTG